MIKDKRFVQSTGQSFRKIPGQQTCPKKARKETANKLKSLMSQAVNYEQNFIFFSPNNHSFRPMFTLTPEQSLRKSLRLPRSLAQVAHWMFDEPNQPFHNDAPLLTAHSFTTSLTVQLRDHWQNFGPFFDPFLGDLTSSICGDRSTDEDNVTSTLDGASKDTTAIRSVSVRDLDMVFTPVTYVTPSVVIGYAFCGGPSFDRELVAVPSGTFRGRSHVLGRFAYDVQNDHVVLIFHGLTPYISGLIDITSNGLSRSRSFFGLRHNTCSATHLPKVPLCMTTFIENRTCFESLFSQSSSPCASHNQNDNSSQTQCSHLPDVRLRDGDINDGGGIFGKPLDDPSIFEDNQELSCRYVGDLLDIASKMNNLTAIMDGAYSACNVHRTVFKSSFAGIISIHQTGSLSTEHFQLPQRARRDVISNVWQLYSSAAFGMRSERREVSLISSLRDHGSNCTPNQEDDREFSTVRASEGQLSSSRCRSTVGKIVKQRQSNQKKRAPLNEKCAERMANCYLASTETLQ